MVVKDGEIKIDAETLSNQDGLSESQAEAVALEAIAEISAGDKKKTDEELAAEVAANEGKSKEEGASGKKTDPTAEELAAAEQEEKLKEEERVLALKDEESSEEDKTKKAEITKSREEVKTKAQQEEVSAYAKEHNVSEDEARVDLDSIAKIQEKYKGDPKQLAKANLNIQRLYTKAEAEAKVLRDAKPQVPDVTEVPIEVLRKGIDKGTLKYQDKPITKEAIIERTRKADPELTETMEDEKVFELGLRELKKVIDGSFKQVKAELGTKAAEKRVSILETVPEADKKYVPELKETIERLSDRQVMAEDFELGVYIDYVKGKTFDATVKQLEEDKKAFGEKEYKRGLEEAKILGVKRPPNGGAPKGTGKTTLTDEQKKRAKEMFDNPDITEERAFELYIDHLKDIGEIKK
jgi:hypothetical protein